MNDDEDFCQDCGENYLTCLCDDYASFDYLEDLYYLDGEYDYGEEESCGGNNGDCTSEDDGPGAD